MAVQDLSPYAPVAVQQGSNATIQAVGSLPASFNLQDVGGADYVTSVKNQGPYGTCWCFATYGSLESSILMAGGPTTDFSERNLAYMSGFDVGYNGGGSSEMSEAYLSRFSGPINESDDPYTNMGTPDSVTGPVQDDVREMLRLDSPTEIKTALMNDGAVYTTIYFDPVGSYYNTSNYTYCYTGTEQPNHAVTIVGWDDNMVTAGGTGAWLVKNSWGTTTSDWGGVPNDNGYFWLSYQDAYGGNSGECFCDAVSAGNYTKNYTWDNFGDMAEFGDSYGFNAFTAATNTQVKSVGFFTEADGATYTVRVYAPFPTEASPTCWPARPRRDLRRMAHDRFACAGHSGGGQ